MGDDDRFGPWSIATVRATVENVVFAPLSLAIKVTEDGPDALRTEIDNARVVGRMAVMRATSTLREAIDSASTPSPGAPVESVDDVATRGRGTSSAQEPPDDGAPTGATDLDAIDPSSLALPDYDSLPAIDIVAKLATLSADDRARIEAYESTHRRRRTVLGKLAQLAAA
ncbi:hypothetical protein [Ilumatobacter sp.]|uniref:hypothetical protein n=1 Tax=Ilumatobacter sp. TaxID=1967498 RepID=UPI003B52470D